MTWRLWSGVCALLMLAGARGGEGFKQFIRVRGDQLIEGERPFRFISFNIPNLHLVEDNVAFGAATPWRWPDRFEIADALESVRQAGGTVVRCYVLSVVRTNDAPGDPRHVLGPGKFNEDGFRALDLVLEAAHRAGVRVILPFVDNWSWWGGIAEYAGFRGKPKEAFWTDPQIRADFQETIRFTLTRRNTLTGVRYCDDQAILCWETGNELQSPPEWTREMAAYIKSLDPNHLVMDGYHTTELRAESLAMPGVDVVTTHHYPGGAKSFAALVRENAAKAKGHKPYVVGEFGFVDTPAMAATLDAVVETGTAGALVWSLRFRNRDGGFYWHSEPAGGDRFKAYHWPGFSSGAAYDEADLLALMRRKAFEIRGLKPTVVPAPKAPRLLPCGEQPFLSWQGSVGATAYVVERSGSARGPWVVIASEVDETAVQYRPLFVDESAGGGRWYYRVRARNGAGTSAPSNAVGPVKVGANTLVDEFASLARLKSRSGAIELKHRGNARPAREDAHRLAGASGSWIEYRVPGAMRSVRVWGYLPKSAGTLTVSASVDGVVFADWPVQANLATAGAGDYGYWTPVEWTAMQLPIGTRFLRLGFGGELELGRVEIAHD